MTSRNVSSTWLNSQLWMNSKRQNWKISENKSWKSTSVAFNWKSIKIQWISWNHKSTKTFNSHQLRNNTRCEDAQIAPDSSNQQNHLINSEQTISYVDFYVLSRVTQAWNENSNKLDISGAFSWEERNQWEGQWLLAVVKCRKKECNYLSQPAIKLKIHSFTCTIEELADLWIKIEFCTRKNNGRHESVEHLWCKFVKPYRVRPHVCRGLQMCEMWEAYFSQNI